MMMNSTAGMSRNQHAALLGRFARTVLESPMSVYPGSVAADDATQASTPAATDLFNRGNRAAAIMGAAALSLMIDIETLAIGDPDGAKLAIPILQRSILESVSQLHWLIGIDSNPGERLQRHAGLLTKSVRLDAYQDEMFGLKTSVDQVELERLLSVTQPEEPPSPTKRVATLVEWLAPNEPQMLSFGRGQYGLISGVAHCEPQFLADLIDGDLGGAPELLQAAGILTIRAVLDFWETLRAFVGHPALIGEEQLARIWS